MNPSLYSGVCLIFKKSVVSVAVLKGYISWSTYLFARPTKSQTSREMFVEIKMIESLNIFSAQCSRVTAFAEKTPEIEKFSSCRNLSAAKESF